MSRLYNHFILTTINILMLQMNILDLYCKVGMITQGQGSVTVYTKERAFYGVMPAQIKGNIELNLWDFGLSNKPLIDGKDISSISVWDKSQTRRYSDEHPEGLLTGKSGTSREARPSIY
jgi:hypothetical protein